MKLSMLCLAVLLVLVVFLTDVHAGKTRCKVAKCTQCVRGGRVCKACEAGLTVGNKGKLCSVAKTCIVEHCTTCNNAGKRCKRCNEGTRRSFNRKICLLPEEEDPDCPTNDCEDFIIDENGNGIDDDLEDVTIEAAACGVERCTKCNKAGKRCRRCNEGTTRSYNRKKCLLPEEEDPDCPTKDCEDYLIDENGNRIDDDEEDVIIPAAACSVERCTKCNKAGKRCRKCNEGTTRSYNRKKCLLPEEEDPDCPTKDCDDYLIDENVNTIDDDDEDVVIPDKPCKIPRCTKCNKAGGRCKKCEAGTTRSKNRKTCLSADEPDPDCPSKDCEDILIDDNNNGIDDDDEDVIVADPCDPNPCANGGTCSGGDCTCASGFEGDNCQTVADPCDPNPCANGGTCTGGDCTCASGFEGDNCQTEVVEPEPEVVKHAKTQCPGWITAVFGRVDTLDVLDELDTVVHQIDGLEFGMTCQDVLALGLCEGAQGADAQGWQITCNGTCCL